MEIIRSHNFHILKEIIDFTTISCNDIRIKSYKQSNCSPFFETAEKIYIKCKDKINLSEDELIFFRFYPSYSCCLAQLLLFSFAPYEEINSLNCKETLLTYFHQYSLDKFPSFVPDKNGLNMTNDSSCSSFVKSIECLDLSNSDKLNLIYTFYDYENTITKLLSILNKIYNQISYYLEINEENQLLIFDNINTLTDNDFIEMSKKLGFKDFLDDNSTIYIYPSLCFFDSYIWIEKDHGPHYIFYGAGMNYKYFFVQLDSTNDIDIHAFLNALSDSKKQEILKLIRHTPRYGQELANLTGLKTPTISYHMDTLFQLHLVKINKVHNRLYYSLNCEELEKMIDLVKDYFL